METRFPIGIFDSGYGGLTVLGEIKNKLPQYDYIYLGDNARTPYGTRSFETVYKFTLESVTRLFEMGCRLVILACNTSSAKALRTIQQKYLPENYPERRVLGVIRPTTEIIGKITQTKNVGILGTSGTVSSNSYKIEINHFFPDINVYQQECPIWVPLVENNEHNNDGTDYFIKKYIDLLMQQEENIDTILLGCTHYPLLLDKINKYIKPGINIMVQGSIVARSLLDYLNRHPEIENKCSKKGITDFYTTDSSEQFDKRASVFYKEPIKSKHLEV